jgi:voltage-gated potassium channel
VGQAVADELSAQGNAFAVVDLDPVAVQRAEEAGYLVVSGDATDDDVLRQAGIERASGLVSTLGTDAGNVFVTLTARVVNPRLLIVARTNSEETENKLARAGADHVISPYYIAGRKMATHLMKPLVSDYLDVVTGGGELEFRLEEFDLDQTCQAIGHSIEELQVRSRTGASILAVRRGETRSFDTNPSPELVLQQGDAIIAIGTAEEIAGLEGLFGCRPGSPRGDSSQR